MQYWVGLALIFISGLFAETAFDLSHYAGVVSAYLAGVIQFWELE